MILFDYTDPSFTPNSKYPPFLSKPGVNCFPAKEAFQENDKLMLEELQLYE